jgi:FkbM family methyltransferase
MSSAATSGVMSCRDTAAGVARATVAAVAALLIVETASRWTESGDGAFRGSAATKELCRQHLASQPAASNATLLDGCWDVYLDLGTNVGVQIRKVYEPQLFPNAMVLPFFDAFFGDPGLRRASVCSVGFEPNPRLAPRLQAIEAAYNAHGWRTRMFTRTGVSDEDGWSVFHSDNAIAQNEIGSFLEAKAAITADTPGATRVVGIPAFVRDEVLKRQVPDRVDVGRPPRMVMKVDVEGWDGRVIAGLMRAGVLCKFDYIYVEHMLPETAAAYSVVLKELGCPTIIQILDDETYGEGGQPLPPPPGGR